MCLYQKGIHSTLLNFEAQSHFKILHLNRLYACVSLLYIYIWPWVEMTELCITVHGSGGWTVWYSCINTKSAWRSAMDVKVLLTSSIFLPVPSRRPCCNVPHCIQLCRVKGVELRAAPGQEPPRHLRLRESTAVSATQPTCIIQLPHTCLKNSVLGLPKDSAGRGIYWP